MSLIHSPANASPPLMRVARAVRGLTQREIARATGLSVWRVWNLEHGLSEPTADEIVKLWGALSTSE